MKQLLSSHGKPAESTHGPLTEEAKAFLQSRVDKTHLQFVEAVARNRGVSVTKVETDFGKGRVLNAQEALAVGLIDRIATLETVLAELAATGSSAGTSGVSVTAGILPGKEKLMHPKILTCLIRAGIVEAGCTEADYKAGIDKFFVEKKATKPNGGDEALAAAMTAVLEMEAKTAASGQQPANGGTTLKPLEGRIITAETIKEVVSVEHIVATVQIATGLSVEDRMALQTDLLKDREKLTQASLLDRVNQAVIDKQPKVGGNRIQPVAAELDKFKVAARDAVIDQTLGGDVPAKIWDEKKREMVDYKPSHGRDYGLQRPQGIGQRLLIACGVPAAQVMGMSPIEQAEILLGRNYSGPILASDGPAYNVSGMFSNILLDASNVVLRKSYDDARTTFQQWMKRAASLPDFKEVNKVIAGELGDPKAIPENGEFEETTLTDGKEKYRLTIWGEVFSFTLQMYVNDQLGAFMEADVKLGRGMRRKQNRLAYGVLKDNAAMADGTALFEASVHKNLQTGAISSYADAFDLLHMGMKNQTGLSSESGVLNITPKYVILPPKLHSPIHTLLGSTAVLTDNKNSGVANIWQGAYTPVEDAELSAAAGGSDTAFYLAADSGDVDTIEYAYLQGLETPRIEMATAFDRLAIRKRIYHAFGVKAIDYRGLQKHAGA